MIKLFGINDIYYRSNGERIIKARKAEVYRDIDGEYKLYLQVPLDETIETNSIIVAPTPWGEQPFRVYTVEAGMYSRTIYARHIFFDAMNYLLDDVAPTDKDAKDALEWIIARTDSPNYFTADSDILDIKTTRHVNKSLYDAVYGLAKAYGGYVVPDGLQIGIYSSLGADKGVTIRYGKNLKRISATENWDNVCTKLLPIGHEGIELPEKYVEADVQYDIPYSRTIRFNPSTGIDVTDEEAVIEDLRAQAEAYVEANKYPQVNYTVEAFEENVDLGDTIHVLHEKADIDILTTVISITYDCIRKKTIRIEFGNFRPSIKGLAKTINETQKSVEAERVERITKTTALEKALEQSEETIMDYLTKGYKYITENAIYFLDNQDPSLAEHVMMLSLGGIAFGEQGINGPFTTAWDIEGNFNANYITTGTMSADRVRTGKIESEDGKVIINLDDRLVDFDGLLKLEKEPSGESKLTITLSSGVALEEELGDKASVDALSQVQQTANKINWLVKDGSNESNFTITDRLINLVSENVEITADNIILEGYTSINETFKIDLSGSMEATAGKIGGWTIAADSIWTSYNASGYFYSTELRKPKSSIDPVFITMTAGTPQFELLANGTLKANKAEIKGSVSATAFEVLNSDGVKIGGLYGTGTNAYVAVGRLVNPANPTKAWVEVGAIDTNVHGIKLFSDRVSITDKEFLRMYAVTGVEDIEARIYAKNQLHIAAQNAMSLMVNEPAGRLNIGAVGGSNVFLYGRRIYVDSNDFLRAMP